MTGPWNGDTTEWERNRAKDALTLEDFFCKKESVALKKKRVEDILNDLKEPKGHPGNSYVYFLLMDSHHTVGELLKETGSVIEDFGISEEIKGLFLRGPETIKRYVEGLLRESTKNTHEYKKYKRMLATIEYVVKDRRRYGFRHNHWWPE